MPYLTISRETPKGRDANPSAIRPIAHIRGGKYDTQFIWHHEGASPAAAAAALLPEEYRSDAASRDETIAELERACAARAPARVIAAPLRAAYAALSGSTKGEQRVDITDGAVFPLPVDIEAGRDVVLISGMAGAGKTTWAAKWCQYYHDLWKDRPIFFVSETKVEDDPALTAIPEDGGRPQDIDLENLLVTDPVTSVVEAEDSCVLVDDIEALDKDMRKKLTAFINKIAILGRRKRATLIICQHLLNDHERTRTTNYEAQAAVIFPNFTDVHSQRYFLGKVLGWNNADIDALKTEGSRWVYIRKALPLVCVSENAAWIHLPRLSKPRAAATTASAGVKRTRDERDEH